MQPTPFPSDLRTEHLYLRPWRTEDAPVLLPILEANVEHLSEWIPAHVATPVPLHDLVLRLVGFAEDFAAGRSWRYALFARTSELVGEVSLFPRSPDGRAPFASADRLEIGYWLDRCATGKGYATEAARAMLDLSLKLPGVRRVEIHCDPRNAASAAVPQRLGFRLESDGSGAAPGSAGMLWAYEPCI